MFIQSFSDKNLPGLFPTLFQIVFCVVIGFLKIGDQWYEILLRIIAFIFALSLGFILYAYITNIIAKSYSSLKRLYHFIMIPILPLIIYIALKIYLI